MDVLGATLATWGYWTSRRLFEIGILVAGVGAGLIGFAALSALVRPTTRARPRLIAVSALVASVLAVAGLVLMILSVHFGVSPFRRPAARAAPATSTVHMPFVLGVTEPLAVQKTHGTGLRVLVVRRPSSEPGDIVLAQSPAGGTSLSRGSMVKLVVSTGKR